MDVKKYLARINVRSEVSPDLETLILLHRQHLYNIPFENLDIHSGRKILLEEDKLLHKIIDEGRGGFCYELNGSFYALLKEIGFTVKRISAGVYEDNKDYSPDFDHMALIVKIGPENFLTDVGFGDSFIEPLEFKMGEIQKDKAGYFKISESEDNDCFILYRLSERGEFTPQYKFSLTPRELKQYNTMCEFHQTSPESHFRQKIICSRATETGRISLSDLRIIITRNGRKEQKQLTENDFYYLLNKHFNISLEDKLIFPNTKSG